MKKLLFALMALFAVSTFTACSDDDGPYEDFGEVPGFNQLPVMAQNFLYNNFDGYDIVGIYPGGSAGGWEVLFDDGTEVDFNSIGQWEEIDTNGSGSIPYGIMPMSIYNFIDNNYPSQSIISVEYSGWGYEVELTNGYDLIFGPDGTFQGLD